MDQPREEFVKWLEERVQTTGGLREAARQADVSHATLSRGLQGEALSLTTLEGISKWTGVSLVRLLHLYGSEVPEDERVEAVLARVLDQHPQLREILAESLDVLDDEAIAGVIEYIEFQAERRRRQS